MEAPCVRAPVEAGEETRQRLASADLLEPSLDIVVEDDHIYIPVADPNAVPDDLTVVTHDVPERRTPTTPADLLGFEPTYERLGDVVIVDEDDPERADRIADAILASDVRAKTVVNRASKIKGETRVRDWAVLAGNGTETVHKEYGHEFHLDIAEVYFSPRLATERHRVVRQVREGEHAFDMFAGVGPYAIPMADAGADVVATDINEPAIDYLRENAHRNGVQDRVTPIHGDVREIANDFEGWANRLVMNLPHSAQEFLDTAVRLAAADCTIHYYDIKHEDSLFGPGERAIRDAAEPHYDVTVETRHTVRSYAPHEYNVCLDVHLTQN